MALIFTLITALLLKHYVADFVLQPPWMLSGKGTLGAPGGYVHAMVHGAGTATILLLAGVGPATVALVAAGECVLHYGIDYVKDRISALPGVERRPSVYWRLHGLDQLLHQLTYVGVTFFAMADLTG